MRHEITQSQAQIICGQIRQRKHPVALFATKTGIEIKQIGKCSDKEIVKKEMEEFETKLREQIRPLVNEISFKGIKSMKDMMRIREELHVYLHWDEAEPVTKEI